MSDRIKAVGIKIIKAIIILAVLISVYFNFFEKTSNATKIDHQLGMAGKVTGVNRARGYKIYLNSTSVPYNFDSFENSAISKNEGLGYYIDVDDMVEKKPNNDTLILTRKGESTIWLYVK